MWTLLYNGLLLLASPIILLVLAAKQRCRRGFPQRLGLVTAPPPALPGRTIWIHAVSLGEVVAVAPLVKELHRRYPTVSLVVSTVTETGREAVEQRLQGIARHRYAPLDFSWVVDRAITELDPALYVFVETELWPNLLRRLRQRRVPSIMVNGRLSTRSFERQRLPVIRDFYRSMLANISWCLMQSERDAERMTALGADPATVRCVGNIKFDQPTPDEGPAGALSNAALGLPAGAQLWVAGSTHPGEEEQLVAAYLALVQEFPELVLVMAPRHIERTAHVEQMIRAKGAAVARRSAGAQAAGLPGTGPRVLILDTRGELALLYRGARLAFVGGTLAPIGGHNVLEPALWAVPVLFGPHVDHCAETAALLTRAEGGRMVQDERDLIATMRALLRDDAARRRMGRAAQQVVMDNQGAIAKSLDIIEAVLRDRGLTPATEQRTPA